MIQTDQLNRLEESSIMKIYDQDFLAATKGELYMGAMTWCLRNICLRRSSPQSK